MRALTRAKRNMISGYLLLSPSLLILAGVVVFPIIYVIYMSFMGFTYGRPTGFVGVINYIDILTDPNFYSSLKATVIFTVGSVSAKLLLALIFAHAIHYAGRAEPGVRLVVLLPYMISMVAGGVTFRWLFNTEFGFINFLLLSIGIVGQPVNFLGEPGSAMASIIFAHLWSGTPFAALILLAGLKSISKNIYEQAQIDGAGFFASLSHITLPLIRPQILVVLLITTMFSFRHFALPFTMTGGGPGVSTRVLAVLLQEKMAHLVFGYNSALSVIMMIITLFIAFFYLKLMTTERR